VVFGRLGSRDSFVPSKIVFCFERGPAISREDGGCGVW
jgi:hypothetical protein